MTQGDFILGVDGGGTSTVASLAKWDGTELHLLGEGLAGPSNINAIDPAAAQANVVYAINLAFQDAQLDRNCASAITLGLAGAGRESARQLWTEFLKESQFAEQMSVVNDAQLVLAMGLGDRHGLAIISGTGSIAIAGSANEVFARTGGWGDRFSDEGSGYAIALAGLRAAARFADGRGPETSLLQSFMNHFGCHVPAELIPEVYADSVNQFTIAQLAKVVVVSANNNDHVAQQIIDTASRELADLVESLARRFNFVSPIPLAVGGGALNHGQALQNAFLNNLRRQEYEYEINFVPKPVLGALQLARELIA